MAPPASRTDLEAARGLARHPHHTRCRILYGFGGCKRPRTASASHPHLVHIWRYHLSCLMSALAMLHCLASRATTCCVPRFEGAVVACLAPAQCKQRFRCARTGTAGAGRTPANAAAEPVRLFRSFSRRGSEPVWRRTLCMPRRRGHAPSQLARRHHKRQLQQQQSQLQQQGQHRQRHRRHSQLQDKRQQLRRPGLCRGRRTPCGRRSRRAPCCHRGRGCRWCHSQGR